MFEQFNNPYFDVAIDSFFSACIGGWSKGGQIYSLLYNMRKEKQNVRLYLGVNSVDKISEFDIKSREENNSYSFDPDLFAPNYNYNIYVEVPDQDSLRKRLEDILEETGLPIGLSIREEDEADHAVTLVGSGLVCCGNQNCKKRWLIRNSWGTKGSGWFDADVFFHVDIMKFLAENGAELNASMGYVRTPAGRGEPGCIFIFT